MHLISSSGLRFSGVLPLEEDQMMEQVTSGMYISCVGILAYFHLSCWVLGITERMGLLKLSSKFRAGGFHWPKSDMLNYSRFLTGEVLLQSFWAHSQDKLLFLFFLSLCSRWLSLFLILSSSSLAFSSSPALSFPLPVLTNRGCPSISAAIMFHTMQRFRLCFMLQTHRDKAFIIGNANDESWSAAAPLEIGKRCKSNNWDSGVLWG